MRFFQFLSFPGFFDGIFTNPMGGLCEYGNQQVERRAEFHPYTLAEDQVTAFQSGQVAARVAGYSFGDVNQRFAGLMEPAAIKSIRNEVLGGSDGEIQQLWFGYLDKGFGHLLSTIGLLSARGTEIEVTPAPKFINSKRRKKGKPPIFEYKTLTIAPLNEMRIPGAKLTGDRAAPRMHWRRGHLRRPANGKKTAVRPCIVGDLPHRWRFDLETRRQGRSRPRRRRRQAQRLDRALLDRHRPG